jgi:cytochrome P450/NADPH-cytochrome P450 reductase
VFGCGNTEWSGTYQAVPSELDEALRAHGARRLHPRGEGDARGDFDAQYRAWHSGLWSALGSAFGLPETAAAPVAAGPRLSVSLVNRQLTNPVIMSYRARPALVRTNRELHRPGGAGAPVRSTRHVEVALPEGVTYRAGDHLGVLPRNPIELIQRVMRRFTLDAGMYLTIIPNSGTHTHLPVDEPAPLLGVLGSCVELQDVATRSAIETMAHYTEDVVQRDALLALTGDDAGAQARYREQVFAPYRSVLDLLEEYPACGLPFDVYLDLLPPLRPRYYSISSSPLVEPEACSITTGVLQAPARSGRGLFTGVCSGHLSTTAPNSTVFVFVREPTIAFRPPADPTVSMIMVGAGTGLAPFRGFLQERAAQAEAGSAVGPSLLFFGCRNPERDYLYADELRDLAKLSSATVRTVFSERRENGRRYVQHELLYRQDEVWELVERGAAIFVCGNANTMAPGVRAALAEIYRQHTGGSAAEAQDWLTELRAQNRFLEDIWGG